MCFSAMVEQDFKKLKVVFDAEVDYGAFEDAFEARLTNKYVAIPRATERNFLNDSSPAAERIRQHILEHRRQAASKFEAEFFKQRTRFNEAERALTTKTTKKAQEDLRISTKLMARLREKISDLKRTDSKPEDSRIFPQDHVPIVTTVGNKRLIKPMRYLLRREGKPMSDDLKFSGCFNARRDNLDRFWKGQFGHTHGVMIVTSFFEKVDQHKFEKRDLELGEKLKSVELHFNPKPAIDMLIACLYSHWKGAGQPDLWSFAAVTDVPPPEVLATGHDRCIVPLDPSNVEAWLDPESKTSTELHQLLEDRARPYYEHRLEAA